MDDVGLSAANCWQLGTHNKSEYKLNIRFILFYFLFIIYYLLFILFRMAGKGGPREPRQPPQIIHIYLE